MKTLSSTLIHTLLALVILSLSACASGPIIDTKGVDMAKYEQDLQECEAISEQIETGKNVAKSALAGAAIGGLIGAIDGDVGAGAGAGGLFGAVTGTQKSQQEELTVVKNCLRNRGYAVLN